MIAHIEMMQTPYLDIWSMLLSGKVPHRMSNSSHLFCASRNTSKYLSFLPTFIAQGNKHLGSKSYNSDAFLFTKKYFLRK